MSLTALLSPHSTPDLGNYSPTQSLSTANSLPPLPFHHQPTYISLTRMLTRYQHILLNHPPSVSFSPIQQQVQSELRSPLPYHRTKWLHNIEHARTLLLQLEHTAQSIKVQSAKRAAVHDLAEKRMVIKKLRRYVEDVGREVDNMGEEKWDLNSADGEKQGETVEQILGRPPLLQKAETHTRRSEPGRRKIDDTLKEGAPITTIEDAEPTLSGRDELFGMTRRRRGIPPSNPSPTSATTSGFANLVSTESKLHASSREHETLTSSLLSLTVQLKQQSQAFAATLATSDKDLLSRALDGLDRNVSSMNLASKTMASLTRMSEGEGFFGRLKLYAMIVGMWMFAILLVFAGPKLRF
jgi:hypothetical protein